jgi:hypothetical protein
MIATTESCYWSSWTPARRAFVPFAHAQSGIRDELTAEALAVIDEMSPGHKRM